MLAYLDTNSGIAGDMTLAALVDAGADAEYIQRQIQSLGLGQVSLEFSETSRHCFRALRLDVRHPPEHAHRHLSDIERMIASSELTAREREMALRLFRKIGRAEAKVHGTTIEEVHFHEVGAIDSIVDIVGVAVALCSLDITRIIASPTPVGSGTIHIAHGPVSVPAPATAELLRGIPIRTSQVQGELTTPTGAAILATLADGFGPVPDMQISRIGYGAGHKDFPEQANLLRVLIGIPLLDEHDEVSLLETNLDDSTGEQLGFAVEMLWKAGALDVYTTAIGMKKNRPGVILSVICQSELRSELENCIFEHTGSLGIRRLTCSRRKLRRESMRVETPFGAARVKLAWLPQTTQVHNASSAMNASDTLPPAAASSDEPRLRAAPEFDDCRQLALESGQSLEVIYRAVQDAALKVLESRSATVEHTHGPQAHSHDHPHSHDHDHSHHSHDHHHDHDSGHDHHHHH